MRRLALAALAVGAVALAAPDRSVAQVHLGPQVSIGDEVGIGGRALVNIADLEGWEGAGSFDLFPEDDLWELSGNFHYNFRIEGAEGLFPYVGTGLNIATVDVDAPNGADDTDLGVNFLAGTKFQAAERFTPYAELRVVAGGFQDVVVTGGLMF